METKGFKANEEQQRVIDFIWGDALVLAPPGCGKTDVLTHRIIKARKDYGISYDQMLCLTFTNRASREMQERVHLRISEPTHGLFIGNLHRFCIRFLHENNLIRLDTSIIDEDDQIEIINDLTHSDSTTWMVQKVLEKANVRTKNHLGFPIHLVEFSRRKSRRRANDPTDMLAECYIGYKRENHLIDFDDIINLAYAAMMRPDFKRLKMSNYAWVQVDEVQDLNPLQFAIIEKLTDPGMHTAVYLGDERQAIFSFIGASLDGLRKLKERVAVFNFDTNYRSPKYLVDFINSYAVENFGVTPNELPHASNDLPNDGGLVMFATDDVSGYEQAALIAAQARQLHWFAKSETIGILTRTNREIDAIAQCLDRHNLEYLKLSRRDIFKMVDYKTLYSHFAVVANEHRGSEWGRILYQTRTVEKMQDARKYVSEFRKAGLSFTDMLRDDDNSYLQYFYDTVDNMTVVVFDTETTGLDVFGDDIIQISAVKMNRQGIVPGSEFDLVIETDKEIPEFLGDNMPNPMRSVYDQSPRTDFRSAFIAFRNYVGNSPVLGHNVVFDVEIMKNNANRRMADSRETSTDFLDNNLDSLKAARLVDPELRSHGLNFMLQHYGLEGVNSHIAIDDVKATVHLTLFLMQKMCDILLVQNGLLQSYGVQRLRKRLRARYKGYYEHTLAKLRSDKVSEENTLVGELQWLYENMLADKYIVAIPRFNYIVELFRKVLVRSEHEPLFSQQLMNHVYDMRTFSESDLYNNGVVKECIHLMTIHKAKGLQFDNVFVYGVDDIPSPMDRADSDGINEAKRILYVAISRARRRLYLCYDGECSKFVGEGLCGMFDRPTPQQLDKILQLEMLYSRATKPREGGS